MSDPKALKWVSTKVSTKSQAVIPKLVREALAISEGDSVAFIFNEDGSIQIKKLTVGFGKD